MSSTPYQTTDTLLRAADLTAVASTGTTTTTPYGFTTAAQADAVVTQLNLIIALLKAHGTSAVV